MLREGEVRIPSGCAISGIFSKKGKTLNGRSIIIFYDNTSAKLACEKFIDKHFDVINLSKIPTKKIAAIMNEPIIMRYFVKPLPNRLKESQLDENEFTVKCVIKINTTINGAYVFSSGKNMGIFKAVGYPEDVGEFYRLDEYEGYCWTAHGRYPTNTPGWWGGAHPFAMLDLSIVHNGEISSYDANRRFIEMFGYKCTLLTDTEVITYLFDHLIRHHGLPIEVAADVLTAPEWDEIDRMNDEQKEYFTNLRSIYSSALVNGPFSVILGSNKGLLAINDRLKLRSLTAATKGTRAYFASEESAIRVVCPNPEKVWSVSGAEPVFIPLEINDKEGVR